MKEPHWKHLTFDFNISLIWLKLSYQLLSYVLKYSTPLNNVGGRGTDPPHHQKSKHNFTVSTSMDSTNYKSCSTVVYIWLKKKALHKRILAVQICVVEKSTLLILNLLEDE